MLTISLVYLWLGGLTINDVPLFVDVVWLSGRGLPAHHGHPPQAEAGEHPHLRRAGGGQILQHPHDRGGEQPAGDGRGHRAHKEVRSLIELGVTVIILLLLSQSKLSILDLTIRGLQLGWKVVELEISD